MRIALMLRTLDETGGIAVYSRYLTEELLALDRRNEYVLLYRSHAHLGRFGRRPNVTECVVRAPHKALWDQLAVPLACWKRRVDVVFHPKFTVPLLAPARTVMVLHGADWFVPDQARFYDRLDVAYIRTMMPIYCRRAAAVLSVSQLTTDNINSALGLPPGKVQTVYFGPARRFRRVDDPQVLAEVRTRYGLPERFVLTLTKLGGAERKNLGGVLEAYRRHHGRTAHKLVVGGKDCHRLREVYGVPETGWGGDVLFPGWIAQEDLPAVYTLADVYLYPSNLEAFPIPLTEAMACGTPIVTSNANGLVEIAGDAALQVDPNDPDAICEALGRVLADPTLRAELSARGLERSSRFTWESCARRTLEILESVARQPRRRGAAPRGSRRAGSLADASDGEPSR